MNVEGTYRQSLYKFAYTFKYSHVNVSKMFIGKYENMSGHEGSPREQTGFYKRYEKTLLMY